MLATLVREPVDKEGWVYEEKYDGDRILAYKEGNHVSLSSRNSKDRTADFPKVVSVVRSCRPKTLLLDGEVVVFDRNRVSRFQLLQQRKGQPVYAVFDCLYQDGRDLRHEPLCFRREAMEESIRSNAIIFASRRLPGNGFQAFKVAKRRGFEGLVAKDLSSPYIEKRSTSWLKVKVHQEDEFVIAGYTAPSGSRTHFGALLLGAYERGKLRYVGKVGTGFDEQTLISLSRKFRPLVCSHPAFVERLHEKNATFLAPRLVVQISFAEWTADQKLRQPVYLGLRDDKNPEEVRLPEVRA